MNSVLVGVGGLVGVAGGQETGIAERHGVRALIASLILVGVVSAAGQQRDQHQSSHE